MVEWTPVEEEKLLALQTKKKKAQEFQRNCVEEVVSTFHFPGMTRDDLVDSLIEHAPALTEALKPWTFSFNKT